MGRRLNVAGFSWAMAFGALATLASLSMEKAGASRLEIGLHSSAYYLSIALGSICMTRLIRLFGNFTIIFGLLGVFLSCSFFGFVNLPSDWLFLRFLNGFCTACTLVPLETLVYQNAEISEKAKIFGFFELCLSAGAGIGGSLAPLLESFQQNSGYVFFGFFPLIGVIALLPIQIKIANAMELESVSFSEIKKLYIWYFTAFTQGFIEGGLLSYLGVLILSMGFTTDRISIIFSSMFAGVICSMLFITRLADAVGFKKVLLLTHFISFFALVFMGFSTSLPILILLVFFVGLTCGGQYAIALASLGSLVDSKKQPSANAMYLTLNCAGSVVGPLVMGLLQNSGFTISIFFVAAGPIFILLLVWFVIFCCYK